MRRPFLSTAFTKASSPSSRATATGTGRPPTMWHHIAVMDVATAVRREVADDHEVGGCRPPTTVPLRSATSVGALRRPWLGPLRRTGSAPDAVALGIQAAHDRQALLGRQAASRRTMPSSSRKWRTRRAWC